MMRLLPIVALFAITAIAPLHAEPQGGYPAARERATHPDAQAEEKTMTPAPGDRDDVQRRQDAVSRRDDIITNSICKGC
jgi:hypothetical protein